MSVRVIKVLVGFMVLLLATACVSFTSPLEPSTRLDPKKGYIYARLTQNHSSTSVGNSGRLRMGLVIQEKGDSEAYNMQFQLSNTVSVIAVKPGAYKVAKVTFVTWDYNAQGEKEIGDKRLAKEFSLEAGKAYYVGDFYGLTISGASMAGTMVTTSRYWQLEEIRNNYNETTKDLTTTFPQFRGIHTVSAIN